MHGFRMYRVCTGYITPFGKCERIEATATRLNGFKLPKTQLRGFQQPDSLFVKLASENEFPNSSFSRLDSRPTKLTGSMSKNQGFPSFTCQPALETRSVGSRKASREPKNGDPQTLQ